MDDCRNEPPSGPLFVEVSMELRHAIERVRDLAGSKLASVRIEVRYFSGDGQVSTFGGAAPRGDRK